MSKYKPFKATYRRGKEATVTTYLFEASTEAGAQEHAILMRCKTPQLAGTTHIVERLHGAIAPEALGLMRTFEDTK